MRRPMHPSSPSSSTSRGGSSTTTASRCRGAYASTCASGRRSRAGGARTRPRSSTACTSATVITDRDTGRSRGFGFVEMSSASEAQKAIAELNGRELQGRTLNVSEARERSGGGGGGGGGDRPRGGGGGFGGRRR